MLSASQADVRYVDNAIEAQSALTADPAWWNVVAQFKSAAAGMEQAYDRLMSEADYVAQRPALRAKFDSLVSRAATVRATVESVRDKLASAVDWFNSLGASLGLNGLGILPIIGIAAIAAAVALVVKWTTDTIKFLKLVSEQRRLEAAGVAPERAAEITQQTAAAASGAQAGWSWLLPVAALGVGGYFVWRQMRGRR